MVRRKAVLERYAAQRCLWHGVGVVERSNWLRTVRDAAAAVSAAGSRANTRRRSRCIGARRL
eukprot:2082774-Prymnesium_polylepis.1